MTKNVKINSKYYQEHVLTPVLKCEIPDLCSQFHQCIKLSQENASSHPLHTIVFQEKKKKTKIKTIIFTNIPIKSLDVSLMYFCAFGLLKSALSKRRPTMLCELWKAVQGVEQNISSNNTKSTIIVEITMWNES